MCGGEEEVVSRSNKTLNCYQLPNWSLGRFSAVSIGQEVPVKDRSLIVEVSVLTLSINFIHGETLGESINIFNSYLKITSDTSTYFMGCLIIKTDNFCKTVTKVLVCNTYVFNK